MFDYLVIVEFEKGMQSCIFPAKKVAKLCAAYAADGISLDCIRLYRLVRNADPEPMYFTFNAKLGWLDVYNRSGTLIEGGVRAHEQNGQNDHQAYG